MSPRQPLHLLAVVLQIFDGFDDLDIGLAPRLAHLEHCPGREVEALRAHLGSESAASIKFQKQLVAAGGEGPRYRVLYIGTDFGVYVSTTGGRQWHVLGGNLPSAQVSDLQYQRRDRMIVISTYGRGLWGMDGTGIN